MRMSARRTILIALMTGGAFVDAAAPALADAEAAAVPLRTMQPDDSGDDDDGRALAGGVETGQGGTANDFEFLLPLSLLGGGAAAAAGAVLIRRRRAGQNG